MGQAKFVALPGKNNNQMTNEEARIVCTIPIRVIAEGFSNTV
jgi:hypothetical protein